MRQQSKNTSSLNRAWHTDAEKPYLPLFTYEGIERVNMDAFIQIGNEIGYPLIVKEAYGSFGEQVYLIQSEDELLKTVRDLDHKPFIIQEFIEHSKGRDIRVNVVGNQVIAAMQRHSELDFRANMTVGGAGCTIYTHQ
ncbi:hypothetical protein RCO48_26145 [Peribacillus frigoritolerans]|nr:hypothetical protein [Peribacillus frigoritolerans]